MKRVFDTLHDMSFELPKDYSLTSDKYNLPNGQGFINKENYLSKSGQVISFFELFRSKDEFFENYNTLCQDSRMLNQKFELEKEFSIRLGDFVFPVYIIKGFNQNLIHVVQIFIDCGDCMGVLMFNIDVVDDDVKVMIAKNKTFADAVKILRSVQ